MNIFIIIYRHLCTYIQNMEDLLEHNSDLSAKLMQIGDSIVYKLVQWTKRLPFYLELPVEVSAIFFLILHKRISKYSYIIYDVSIKIIKY